MEPLKQRDGHTAADVGAGPSLEPSLDALHEAASGYQFDPVVPRTSRSGVRPADVKPEVRSVRLNPEVLEARRVIAHDIGDQRAKSFDMLRTQVLQAMDAKSWQVVGVTSPTAGCGKTLTALNLAISIARQPERSVLLADMDLRKPQVARRLGLQPRAGLLSVLGERASLSDALVRALIGRYEFLTLPAEAATDESSEWMASGAMKSLVQRLRSDFPSRTIILDLPPMLLSDDVIALLPQVDCVLLVTAVAQTTVSEVEECNRYLQASNIVRVVVNKVPEWNNRYYY